MPTMIGEYSEGHLLKVAKDAVAKKTENTTLLDKEAEDRIPKFKMSELDLGRVLGRGGFCVVKEITKISLAGKDEGNGEKKMDDEHHIYNIIQDRNFMASHCIRSGRDCRYALKILQDSSRKDAQTFVSGIVDLAVEARFLSVVRHPNIIKMRAMAAVEDAFSDANFFVVLDRLYDILTVRVVKWKKSQVKGMKRLFDRKGKKALAFWVERLTVAYDLACALKYMHDLEIVYRDIKPDNIGFDVRGDVKVFDLGLAKELSCTKSNGDGTYLLTGDTGSPRYMATEVAQSKPYNERCDCYSFAILLWQILAMETPFEGYSVSMFNKKVVAGGARPKCDEKWPAAITAIMKKGWGPLAQRPSMGEMADCLKDEINRVSDNEVNEILDISRKSEMSMHAAKYG